MSETTQSTDKTDNLPPRRGWFGRNWKWCVPLLSLLAIIVLGLSLGRGELLNIFFTRMKIQKSEPYKIALEAVQADPTVIEKLGEPVKPGGTISGNLTDTDCQIFFDVTGPNGTADVTLNARVIQETWAFSQLEVKFSDGSRITVETASEEGGLEDAPAWNPPT